MQAIEKNASVHWEGGGRQGKGTISTQTAALNACPYGFGSRFQDERRGTNPEELLAAAHAACFTMAFSFACEKAGFTTSKVETRAVVRLVAEGEGFLIDRIVLQMQAVVPGIDETQFAVIAQTAKTNCPLSKALASVPDISLEARLIQA